MATGKTWDEMLKDLELQLNSGSSSSSSSSTSSPNRRPIQPPTELHPPSSPRTKTPSLRTPSDTTPSNAPETLLSSPSRKSDKKKRSKDKNTSDNSTTNNDAYETTLPNNSVENTTKNPKHNVTNNLLSTPKPINNSNVIDPTTMQTPELILTKDANYVVPSSSLSSSSPSSFNIVPDTDATVPSSVPVTDNTQQSNRTLVPSSSSPSQSSLSSPPQQQPVLLTGAVAHALADAVAKAVNRVDKWQKKSEAQDKVIHRLRQEMIKAGITLPPLTNSNDDNIPFDSTNGKSTDTNNENDGSVPSFSSSSSSPSVSTIQRTPGPLLSASKSNDNNSSIPSTVTLKLGPNAVNLLKQSGFGNTSVPTKNASSSSSSSSPSSNGTTTNGIVANSNVDSAPIPSTFPFTPTLVTAVALAHAGHPDRLCAETAACGTLARQLRIEVQLLRSVIEQLRTEHQRRMKAQSTIIDQLRDRVQELEGPMNGTNRNNKSTVRNNQELSKSPNRNKNNNYYPGHNTEETNGIPSQFSPIPSSGSVTLHTPTNNTFEENTGNDNNYASNEQALWRSIPDQQQDTNRYFAMDNAEDNHDDNPYSDDRNDIDGINDSSRPQSSDSVTNYYSRPNDDRILRLDELSNNPVSSSAITRGRSTKVAKITNNSTSTNQYSSVYKQDPNAINRARSASNRRQRTATNDPKTPTRNRPVSAGPMGRTVGRNGTAAFGSSRLSNPVPPRTPGGGLSFTAGLHPPQATSPPTVLRRGTGLGAGGALLRVKNTQQQQGMSDELKAAILGKPNIPSTSTLRNNTSNKQRSRSRGASNPDRNNSRVSVGNPNHRYTTGPQGGTFAKAGTSPVLTMHTHGSKGSSHLTEKKSPVLDTAAATAVAAARIKDYKRTHHQVVLPVIKLLHPPGNTNRHTVSPPPLPVPSQYTGVTKGSDNQIEFADSLGVTAISNKRALHVDSVVSEKNTIQANSSYTIPSSLLAVLDNLTKGK